MFSKSSKRIYLDHASGTAIDPHVFKCMKPYFTDLFYNPSAIYKEGVNTHQVIDQARNTVATILKARKEEIFFIDGGTEANNIAILGTVHSWQKNNTGKTAHIITTEIEHASVLETCKVLEKEDVEVTYLSVNENGLVDHKEFKDALRDNTILVSIGYVNGEIGTVQDIKGIMKIVRHHRKTHQSTYPYLHTDAIQAVNYVEEIGIPQLGIDLMTINASKIYGPKKIAVLFKKSGIQLDPIIFGGNQEHGLRSGTENVPYIVGMEESLLYARKHVTAESERLRKLQEYTIHCLEQLFNDVIINVSNGEKIPNIVNVTFPELSHEEIVIRLDAKGIMCSVKSACKAGEDGDSHVIKAIRNRDTHTGSIRFSFGRSTTQKDINFMLKELTYIIECIKKTQKDYPQK